MLEDLLNGSILEMSRTPFESSAAVWAWGDCLANRILVLVAVVLCFFFIRDFLMLVPSLIAALDRAKASVSIEHSLGLARDRNRVALVLALPFCLMVDRYLLYSPKYLSFFSKDYSALIIIAVLIVFLFIRQLAFWIFHPKRISGEVADTVHHAPFNFFIGLVVVMLVSVGILTLCHCPDNAVRVVLLVEIAASYFFTLIRLIQILNYNCNVFVTFLYLCTLEILPTGILVASAIVL